MQAFSDCPWRGNLMFIFVIYFDLLVKSWFSNYKDVLILTILRLFMGHLDRTTCTVYLISAPDQLGRKKIYHYIRKAKTLLSWYIYIVNTTQQQQFTVQKADFQKQLEYQFSPLPQNKCTVHFSIIKVTFFKSCLSHVFSRTLTNT